MVVTLLIEEASLRVGSHEDLLTHIHADGADPRSELKKGLHKMAESTKRALTIAFWEGLVPQLMVLDIS